MLTIEISIKIDKHLFNPLQNFGDFMHSNLAASLLFLKIQ